MGFRSDQDDKSKVWEGDCSAERTSFVESLQKHVSLEEAVFFCLEIHDPNDNSLCEIVSLVTEDKKMYIRCSAQLARREPILTLLDVAEEMGCSEVQVCISRDAVDAATIIKSFLYFGFSLHQSDIPNFIMMNLAID